MLLKIAVINFISAFIFASLASDYVSLDIYKLIIFFFMIVCLIFVYADTLIKNIKIGDDRYVKE